VKWEFRRARCYFRAVDPCGVCRVGVGVESGGEAVNGENIAGLILAVGLVIFLVVALLFPERF
jgi:K+-transporting ATPase KdpF subunit